MKNIPLFKVFTSPEAPELVKDVLVSGWVGQAQKVEDFEAELKKRFNNNFINTLNSATSGLHLALHMVKYLEPYPEKDEVLTIPLTCLATSMPILANGLKIKWIDTDPETCNVDLLDLERKLSSKTKAIMVVHWGGSPCDIDALKRIQKRCYDLYGYEPPIIEDCAHAWEARYKNEMIGNSGNYCIFSFQAIKHIHTGDGGLLISPNEKLHRIVKLKRWFGLDRESSADFRCQQTVKNDMWGFKFHMNDIAATIGLSNLKHSDWIVSRHKENGKYYDKNLKDIQGIKTLKILDNCESSYWIYTILVEDRNGFVQKLKENGIATSQTHRRNDIQECFGEFIAPLPTTDYIDKHMICIPSGWWVTEEDREFIVDIIKKGW